MFVDFVKKNIESDKVRDHCHLTGKFRSPPHVNVTLMLIKIRVILYHLYFTILVSMTLIHFFKKLVDKKNDKVKFEIIPKTDEQFISVRYACIRFLDGDSSYQVV